MRKSEATKESEKNQRLIGRSYTENGKRKSYLITKVSVVREFGKLDEFQVFVTMQNEMESLEVITSEIEEFKRTFKTTESETSLLA